MAGINFTKPNIGQKLNIVKSNGRMPSRSAFAMRPNDFKVFMRHPLAVDTPRRITDITSVAFKNIDATHSIGEIQTSLAEVQGAGSSIKIFTKAIKSGDHENIDHAEALKCQAEEITRTNKLLYPGMEKLIENTQASLKTSAKWGLPEKSSSLLSAKGLVKAASLLFLASPTLAYASAAVTAVLSANIVPFAIAGLAAFSLASMIIKTKNPYSVTAKITGVGKRLFWVALLGGLYLATNAVAGTGVDILAALKGISWKVPLAIGTGLGMIVGWKTVSDIRRGIDAQYGLLQSYTDKQVKDNLLLPHLTLWAQNHYLATRLILYAATLVIIAHGLPLDATAIQGLFIPAGLLLNRYLGKKAAEALYQGIKHGQADRMPIASLLGSKLTQLGFKYGPALGAGIMLSGGEFIWPFATFLMGNWALRGDFHSGIHSNGWQLNSILSVFATFDPLIL